MAEQAQGQDPRHPGVQVPGSCTPTSRRFGVLSISSIVALFKVSTRVSSFCKSLHQPAQDGRLGCVRAPSRLLRFRKSASCIATIPHIKLTPSYE
jgi:hypothetical protein